MKDAYQLDVKKFDKLAPRLVETFDWTRDLLNGRVAELREALTRCPLRDPEGNSYLVPENVCEFAQTVEYTVEELLKECAAVQKLCADYLEAVAEKRRIDEEEWEEELEGTVSHSDIDDEPRDPEII